MELWATGFNAWNQLKLQDVGDLTSNPEDVYVFSCILQDQLVDVLRTSVSATLIQTSSGLKVLGAADELTSYCLEKEESLPKVAIAGNDTLTECKDGTLTQYSSISAYRSNQGSPLRQFDRLQQLVANQTTFTALTSTGTVYTWGDGRYESCLARKVTESCQASTPCLVEDLLDLPTGKIRKISSGGYITAALTVGNDLYVWGGRPGQTKLLEDMEDYPTPVDLEGLDFLDVAVGDGHILALSTDGRLFVVGAGRNGQLGLGENVNDAVGWKEVVLQLREGQKVRKVYAGYKNSFIVVD